MFNVNISIHYSVILIIEELRLYLRHGIKNRWRVTPYITHRLRTLKLGYNNQGLKNQTRIQTFISINERFYRLMKVSRFRWISPPIRV